MCVCRITILTYLCLARSCDWLMSYVYMYLSKPRALPANCRQPCNKPASKPVNQPDRQADREADRQIDRQQTYRQHRLVKLKCLKVQTASWIVSTELTGRQTCKQTEETGRQKSRQSGRRTDGQGRQASRRTDMQPTTGMLRNDLSCHIHDIHMEVCSPLKPFSRRRTSADSHIR